MKIPYNQALVLGDVVFAARSGWIESFNLLDGSFISVWKHPDAGKFGSSPSLADSKAAVEDEVAKDEDTVEPPTKRQKTSEDEGVSASKASEVVQMEEPSADLKDKVQGKKAKSKDQTTAPSRSSQQAGAPDRPVVVQLTSTSDGKHVIATTGHDKAIWVFEHDGAGQLKELSKRVMPKRPSAISVGPGSQIICADKFGDVYGLPLIPSDSPVAAPRFLGHSKPFTKPTANETTVHSKKNLATLKTQKRQAELDRQKAEAGETKAEGPDFELTLLLGHVSMLTSMVLGDFQGKPVILTADRDEHIRVSRYIPQAHIIQGFCLGHKDFVTSLAIPKARGEILVSGGGDDDLFVWNWQTSSLLSRASVLSLAKEISPETAKIAVSGLWSFDHTSESGNATYILAICEGVKAIFTWQLTEDNNLKFPSIIQVPGNPLDLSLGQSGSDLPTIIAAIDAGDDAVEVESLNVYTLALNEGTLAVGTVTSISRISMELSEVEASVDEVRRLLYNVENLRKLPVDFTEGAEEGDVAPDTPVADKAA